MADIELNTIVYYKGEIDDKLSTEATRVNTALGTKLNTATRGAPAGVASLVVTGKHNPIEIPFADITQSGDATNDSTVMTPERTIYQIQQKAVAVSKIGAVNGIAPLDGNGLVPAANLPPQRAYQTYVVQTLAEMYALPQTYTILKSDRAVVINEPTDVGGDKNGEWIAGIDAPSSLDWSHIPNINAVSSVNGQVGIVNITNTAQGTTNAGDISNLQSAYTILDTKVTDRGTVINNTGISVNTMITPGVFHVTDGLPDGLTTSLMTVLRDKRTVVSNGYIQQLTLNSGGVYATRTTIDAGTTWSAWSYVTTDVKSSYYDYEPQGTKPAASVGRMFFDNTKGVMSYFHDAGLQPIDIGTQLNVKVYNNTGVSIPKGTPIQYSGVIVNGYPAIRKSDASMYATATCNAITGSEILNGTVGTVVNLGLVEGVDLSAYTSGDLLYVAVGGGFTKIKPSIDSLAAIVLSNSVSGSMFSYPHPPADVAASGYLQKTSSVVTLTTSPATVVGYNTQVNDNMTSSLANGTLTVPYTGSYKVEVTLDGTASAINREVTISLMKNAVSLFKYGFATNVGVLNRGSASFTFTIDALADDLLSLQLEADSAVSFTISTLQFALDSKKLVV